MTKFGIKFDGKHSYKDLGLRVVERIVGNPSKIKRKERVPFSNTVYDFSGVYGNQEYEERALTYVFDVKDYDKVDLSIKRVEVLNWLVPVNRKEKLFDDYIPGYYFLAEIEEGPNFEELRFRGRLSITFTAYPFKIGELLEGHDIWDEFNFLLDYAQVTAFNVSGTETVTIYNPGASIVNPKIQASTSFEIVKGNRTFNVPSGTSQSHDFVLNQGANKMTLKGNGSIEFLFYKELI